MTDTIFDRMRSSQRKWYIQPCDCRSAEKIYKKLSNSERVEYSEVAGNPTRNDFHLRATDRKTVLSLMEEALNDAPVFGGTDFGLNFYVYMKERNEKMPRFRFAATDEMRKMHREKLRERTVPEKLELSLVVSERIPLFEKDTSELVFGNVGKETVAPPKSTGGKPSLYRISTFQKKIITVLSEEMIKAGRTAEPIPGLMEGSEKKEFVWNVTPETVLAMKAFAKNKTLLFFKIWKRNEKGQYILVGKYPEVKE